MHIRLVTLNIVGACRDPAALAYAIKQSCEIKAELVLGREGKWTEGYTEFGSYIWSCEFLFCTIRC